MAWYDWLVPNANATQALTPTTTPASLQGMPMPGDVNQNAVSMTNALTAPVVPSGFAGMPMPTDATNQASLLSLLQAPPGYGGAAAHPTNQVMTPSAATSDMTTPTTTDLTAAPGGAPPIAPGVMLDDQGNVISGNDQGSTDQTGQGSGGGILQNIMSSAQGAVSDPDDSQGFLGKLAGGLKEVGDKLTSLSPAASQGLISAGLGMLAANNGRANLAQIVGEGGVQGMNTYQTIKQNEIANAALLQQRQIEDRDVMPDQIVESRKMLEAGLDLLRAVFVNPVAVELDDHDAVDFSCGIEEPVGLDVKYAAVVRHRRFCGNDIARGDALKNIRTHGVVSQ